MNPHAASSERRHTVDRRTKSGHDGLPKARLMQMPPTAPPTPVDAHPSGRSTLARMDRTIPLERVEEVGSTSDELKQRAAAGAGECALLARRQTCGRGRLGRSWGAVDGNLLLSVLLRPTAPFQPGPWSLLAAVAVAEALEAVLPPGAPQRAPLRLKWPNDVLLNGAKVAGILLEAGLDAGPGARPWLVAGFGVNLAGAPRNLDRPTASVADLVSPPPTPDAFAPSLLATLARWRATLDRDGFPPIRAAWLARGPARGDPVAAGAGPKRVAGRFAGIGPDGALLLDGPGGVAAIRSGEVE